MSRRQLKLSGSPVGHRTGWPVVVSKPQPGEPSMRTYKKHIREAKPKAAAVEKSGPILAGPLPLAEFMAGVRDDIEAFAAELGLIFIRCVMEAEIEQKLGPWGQQQI